MKLSKYLHIMYLVLSIGAMVMIALGYSVITGYLIFAISFVLWCVLFSVECKNNDDASR